MDFGLLPDKARRAAFAHMSAADKAAKGSKLGKSPRKKRSKGSARKAAPTSKSGGRKQVPLASHKAGTYSDDEINTLISNYREMHGKAPSPAQLAKLRRKRRK